MDILVRNAYAWDKLLGKNVGARTKKSNYEKLFVIRGREV